MPREGNAVDVGDGIIRRKKRGREVSIAVSSTLLAGVRFLGQTSDD